MSIGRLTLVVLVVVPAAAVGLEAALAVSGAFDGGGAWFFLPLVACVVAAYVIPRRAGQPLSLCFVFVVGAVVVGALMFTLVLVAIFAVACSHGHPCVS